VLFHVGRAGLNWVPAPCEDRLGRTFVRHRENLWELGPWLPGKADFWHNPQPVRLEAAARALAAFHTAAATYPDYAPRTGRSPGVLRRLERVRRYAAGDLNELCRSVVADVWPEFSARARAAVLYVSKNLGALEVLLETASTWEVPLQPCLRDVWHDHVLFTGNRVTGLIDYGAMGIEGVAADAARLLGSLSESLPGVPSSGENLLNLARGATISVGLAAYESVRPMSKQERALVEVFDRSGTLLGAMNWVEWLYRERRQFIDSPSVARRLSRVLDCLERVRHSTDSQPSGTEGGGLWLSSGSTLGPD
jgi:homoserine kinase type II